MWPTRRPVKRRHKLTPDVFERMYVARNRPVILEGEAEPWRHRWTPETLQQRYGDQEVRVKTREYYYFDRKERCAPLRDFPDSARSASPQYQLHSLDFLAELPAMREEFQQAQYFASYFGDGALVHNLWIPGGAVGAAPRLSVEQSERAGVWP